jgi:hypothetical protein
MILAWMNAALATPLITGGNENELIKILGLIIDKI